MQSVAALIHGVVCILGHPSLLYASYPLGVATKARADFR